MDGFFQLRPKKYTTKLQLTRSHAKEIVFRHGHIAITDYKLGDNKEFEKSLSVFNEQKWRYELKGGYYVKELREFRVNRAYNPGMLSRFFQGYHVRVENDAYPSDKISIKLLAPPRDDFQRVALSFMCSQGEFNSNIRYTQQLIDAMPGDGKTYCGTATACFMEARTVVIVPIGEIMEQWAKTYEEFTSLKKDEILIVRGSQKCKKILEGKYPDVKAFIFSADTIGSFCDTYGNLETIEMLRATNAHVKIVDEVHRDLKLMSRIEALSNFHMNFYMSATPGRTAKKENWIFKTCFHNLPRFGSKFKTTEELHINVLVKRYRYTPTTAQQGRMIQKRTGYLNSKSYERELFSAPDVQQKDFCDSLISMLKWSKGLLKEKNKILIMCETIDGTAFLKNIAEQIFPGQVSRFYGSLSQSDKKAALEAKIICATVSSLGTGADIKGVQHVYNVTTGTSWISIIQTAGRARALADGTSVFYVDFFNGAFIKTLRQFEKRKPVLAKLSRTGKIMLID